jgi:dihydroneopterin aldolase
MAADDRIELRGLRLSGIVGVLPHERTQAQPLEVDLDLELDVAPAAASDDLTDTVDYGAVCDAVEAVVTTTQFELLEALVVAVADAVLAVDARVDRVTVALRKLEPPTSQQLATSGVRVTRERAG